MQTNNNYWLPDGPRVAFIDGDLLVYSGCAKFEDETDFAPVASYFDEYIEGFIEGLDLDHFVVCVTAGGNFRNVVYPEYKANRKSRPKPKWLGDSYRYLYSDWGAKAERTYEADDLLGIGLSENGQALLVSYDKDLDQIPGWHFNWKKGIKYYVTPEEADRFLAVQLLAGDMTDNIPGIRGIGPKKAEAILCDPAPLDVYLDKVVEAYKEKGIDFDTFSQYYKCLKILRSHKQEWPELEQLRKKYND